MRVDETICIAAIFQALTVKLWKLYDQNLSFRSYTRALISENKARAARWGVESKLIDFGKREEVPFVKLLDELLSFVDDVVDELGSRKDVEYVNQILLRKPRADRQRAVYEKKTGDLKAVVDYIVAETTEGVEA